MQTELSPITLTQKAFTRLTELRLEKKNPKLNLRVYIVGGGCSGFQYGFSLDEDPREDDMIIEQTTEHSTKIYVDPLSFQYLEGAIVDYKSTLQYSRFVVDNPNAETTCGCGSSFSLKEDS